MFLEQVSPALQLLEACKTRQTSQTQTGAKDDDGDGKSDGLVSDRIIGIHPDPFHELNDYWEADVDLPRGERGRSMFTGERQFAWI
jgi:hypothetical protein